MLARASFQCDGTVEISPLCDRSIAIGGIATIVGEREMHSTRPLGSPSLSARFARPLPNSSRQCAADPYCAPLAKIDAAPPSWVPPNCLAIEGSPVLPKPVLPPGQRAAPRRGTRTTPDNPFLRVAVPLRPMVSRIRIVTTQAHRDEIGHSRSRPNHIGRKALFAQHAGVSCHARCVRP
jgi:hypothetical protein